MGMFALSVCVDRGRAVDSDDLIGKNHPVHVVGLIVGESVLLAVGIARSMTARVGRLCCHPSLPLKLLVCDYLSRVPFSRRAERRTDVTVLPHGF